MLGALALALPIEVSVEFHGEPPEEVKRLLKAQMDQAVALNHAFSAEVKDLIGSLTPERLATLRTIFNQIATYGDGESIARYYEGIASAVLAHVHGVCSGCGHDHADEFLEEVTSEEEEQE